MDADIPLIKDISFAGKRVLLRTDYNVPLVKDSGEGKTCLRVADGTRVDATLPTIEAILVQKPNYLVIVSHLGRPEGRVNPELSLEPVASYLESKLGRRVIRFAGPLDFPTSRAPPNGMPPLFLRH